MDLPVLKTTAVENQALQLEGQFVARHGQEPQAIVADVQHGKG